MEVRVTHHDSSSTRVTLLQNFGWVEMLDIASAVRAQRALHFLRPSVSREHLTCLLLLAWQAILTTGA